MLSFTALGFFLLLTHLDPEPTISLDTDWFYRRGLSTAMAHGYRALVRAESASSVQIYEFRHAAACCWVPQRGCASSTRLSWIDAARWASADSPTP